MATRTLKQQSGIDPDVYATTCPTCSATTTVRATERSASTTFSPGRSEIVLSARPGCAHYKRVWRVNTDPSKGPIADRILAEFLDAAPA